MAKIVFFLFLFFLFSFCGNERYMNKFDLGKYKVCGVSFVGMNYPNEESYIEKLKEYKINWMSQMPYAFQRNNASKITFNHQKQWWGESSAGITQTTIYAKKHSISTMMKPQIWMGGEYTGKMVMDSPEKWAEWEKSYSSFIMYFAQLADSLNHEAFCIGTELQPAIEQNPKFWDELIDSIRTFYTGKLTYAANWDEYQRVPFWKKLDWIGINAYFPLSGKKTPPVKELLSTWRKIIPDMEEMSDSVERDVVFTEIGYKSVDACAEEPWNPSSKNLNIESQHNAYKAFLIAFNRKKWFDGYFLWKWYPDHKKSGGHEDIDYTPQNKRAEFLLKM